MAVLRQTGWRSITLAELAHGRAGDHTVSRVALTGLSRAGLSRAGLSREVCGAADSIEAITGRHPETFAYPNGQYDAAPKAAVRPCPGIMLAVTTRWVSEGESPMSPFEVPRMPVRPGTSPTDLLHIMESNT